MATPEIAGFMFLLELGRWAKSELSQRWKFRREQASQPDEIAEQDENSPELRAIWDEMTRERSEREVHRILKLIDDNRQLIIGYEQSKVNAKKQARRDGNHQLLQDRLQMFDEDIEDAKQDMKRHAAKLGIEIEE